MQKSSHEKNSEAFKFYTRTAIKANEDRVDSNLQRGLELAQGVYRSESWRIFFEEVRDLREGKKKESLMEKQRQPTLSAVAKPATVKGHAGSNLTEAEWDELVFKGMDLSDEEKTRVRRMNVTGVPLETFYAIAQATKPKAGALSWVSIFAKRNARYQASLGKRGQRV